MKPPLLHTAYKVTSTRNAYGDYVASGTSTLKCHVRIVNELTTTANNEQIQSDAMMWFEPDCGVEKGDIIKFEGTHYRVERKTDARRLRSTEVLFIKCDMLKYGAIS